mgnify:CR=1 FL=1
MRYTAIADVFNFIRSATSNAYCDRWIKAADWLRIICTEYDLIVEKIDFTTNDFFLALQSRGFKFADYHNSYDGVFRDEYRIGGKASIAVTM